MRNHLGFSFWTFVLFPILAKENFMFEPKHYIALNDFKNRCITPNEVISSKQKK